MSNHQFSSCIVRVGAPGNTQLSSSNLVGTNQDVELAIQYGRHDLFDAAQNSVFAVDTADHEGKASLKLTNKDVAQALLQYTSGASFATSGSATVYSIGQTSKPQYCRVEFDGIDSNGKNIHFIATRVKFRGHTISAKITDFADLTLEADLYPDPNAQTAGTVFTYSVDN